MPQGWSEPQSTTQKIALPEFDMAVTLRDGTLISSSRQRTSQACDKCRERKTKCSGERPVCKRCTARGLICTYSCREPRSRGPSKPRPRAASTIELPSITMHNLKTTSPSPCKISQHYRTISLPQQSIPLARAPAKVDSYAGVPILPESPSRRHMSRDIEQLQSKRLNIGMFSPARKVHPMVRDPGQISQLAKMGSISGLSIMAKPTLNLPSSNNNLTTQVPSSTGFEYMALDHQFQQFGRYQGDGCPSSLDGNAWNYNDDGGLRYVDQSGTPPGLSRSTSTSVTHSPSSSEHDWEVHYQSIGDIERLMASYTDTTFCERPLDIPRGHMSDAVFGRLEPPALLPPFKVGNEGMNPSTVFESGRNGVMLELQSPTPVTPIGMGKLEDVVDSSALAR